MAIQTLNTAETQQVAGALTIAVGNNPAVAATVDLNGVLPLVNGVLGSLNLGGTNSLLGGLNLGGATGGLLGGLNLGGLLGGTTGLLGGLNLGGLLGR